ncbi:MAG: carboxypeptidase-like regulatory domain-containing protein [Myxococcota bacterium]
MRALLGMLAVMVLAGCGSGFCLSYTDCTGEGMICGGDFRCQLDPDFHPCKSDGYGDLEGKVCAPNRATPIPDAVVSIDTDEGTFTARTDAKGQFTLISVPAGKHTVRYTAGKFAGEKEEVEICADDTRIIGQAPGSTVAPTLRASCLPVNDDQDLGVVTGSYDQIQEVLNRLGFRNLALVTGEDGSWKNSLLQDFAELSKHDVVFINCGVGDAFFADAAESQVAVQNLRQFVAGGGSVYASDWAYTVVEATWPEAIDYYGDDAVFGAARGAAAAEDVTAVVAEPALRDALGTSQMKVNFNLGAWVAMVDAAPSTKVYVRGPATVGSEQLTNIPYVAGFKPVGGGGNVIYTSFHQEAQTTRHMDMILELLVFQL